MKDLQKAVLIPYEKYRRLLEDPSKGARAPKKTPPGTRVEKKKRKNKKWITL